MPPNESSTSAHPRDTAGENLAAVDKTVSSPPPSVNYIEISHKPNLALPRPMDAPPGFPPELLGRGLCAAEFFHIFRPILISAKAEASADAPHADESSQDDDPEHPTAWGFMSALAGTDLDSFFCVCRYLEILLNCLRARRKDVTEVPPIKKRHILELVWQELSAPFGNSSTGVNHGRSNDVLAARANIKRQEYSQISVLNKLALFEGLMHYIVELPDASKWVPIARLEPLALDWDGSRLWWMSCAPDRVIAEMRSPASAAEAWRCYDTPEALNALRLAAATESKLAGALDRIIELNKSEKHQQRRLIPRPCSEGAAAWTVDPVFEYQRSKFTSRLIGCAELMNSQLSHGNCMSMHRLRHYLIGSKHVSELADCLLQFERHLKPEIRLGGYEGKQWRERVHECKTISCLNLLLDEILLSHQPLAQYLGGRRGMCARCHQPVTAGRTRQFAFCYACCFNYHRQCVVELVDTTLTVDIHPATDVTPAADINSGVHLQAATDVTPAADVAPGTDVTAPTNVTLNAVITLTADTQGTDIPLATDVAPAADVSPVKLTKSAYVLRDVKASVGAQDTTERSSSSVILSDSTFRGLWKCAECLKLNQTGLGKAGVSSRKGRRDLHLVEQPHQSQLQNQQEQPSREQPIDESQDNQTLELQPEVEQPNQPLAQSSAVQTADLALLDATFVNFSEVRFKHMATLNLACPSTSAHRQNKESAARLSGYCGKAYENSEIDAFDQRGCRPAGMAIEGICGPQTCQSNAVEDETNGSEDEITQIDNPKPAKRARKSNEEDQSYTI